MALDEFEAIRLADLNGLKQEDAARQMEVSRPTFGRILESAHLKVATALTEGRALRIEGGTVCTVKGHGPRDCPRWNRGVARRDACIAPCGQSTNKHTESGNS
jgi:hypothetical protein